MSRSVVILGKGELACNVLGWFDERHEYTIRGVVPVVPEPTWSRSLTDHARSLEVPVLSIKDCKGPGFSTDLLVSVFWDKILKDKFIGKFGKCINLHNSALPAFRGVNPINWALKTGASYHGVTIHEILPGVDDGPIYGQIRFPIDPSNDEVEDVYELALRFGFKLFEAVMPSLWERVPFSQDENAATPVSYYDSSRRGELGDRSNWTRETS